MERRELKRDSMSVMPRLPVREISMEASGEEGADEGLQVGDAEVSLWKSVERRELTRDSRSVMLRYLSGSQWRGGS